jgi:hypothetical protein
MNILIDGDLSCFQIIHPIKRTKKDLSYFHGFMADILRLLPPIAPITSASSADSTLRMKVPAAGFGIG